MPAVVDKEGKESIRIPSKLHVGRANVFFGQETEKLIAIDGGSIEVLHRRGKNKGLPRGDLEYTVIIQYISYCLVLKQYLLAEYSLMNWHRLSLTSKSLINHRFCTIPS